MVSSDSCMKGYSLYSSIKLVTVASVLLAFAVARRREIDNHYNGLDLCENCYSASQALGNQHLLFEFGRCAFGWRMGQKADNLLRPGGFWEIGVGSAVYSYTPSAAIIFVAVVIISVCLPLVSWHACGCNFDYAMGPFNLGENDDLNAAANNDRRGIIAREDARRNAPANAGGNIDVKDDAKRDGSGNGNAGGGDVEAADGAAVGVEGSARRRGPQQINYGFGFVTHNDQCVFLHYQLALLSALILVVLSQLIGELYPASFAVPNGVSTVTCYVSAYTRPMDMAFDVLTFIAVIFLLIECFVNLCVPQHRFFFNVMTGAAMVAIVLLAEVMAFTNVLGPANDWVTFWTTLIAVLHMFEVPIVLLTVVSRSRPVDYMHL